MDLSAENRLKSMVIIIAVGHGVIYLSMLIIFARDGIVKAPSFKMSGVMVVLGLPETVFSFVLIWAVLEKRAQFFIPWLMITPLMIAVGLLRAFTVFDFGRRVWVTSVMFLSFVSLFPVFHLYRKFNVSSSPAPSYGATDSQPLANPGRIPAAHPVIESFSATDGQTMDSSVIVPTAPSITAAYTSGDDPPSYDFVMGNAPCPPYPVLNPGPVASSATVGWRTNLDP